MPSLTLGPTTGTDATASSPELLDALQELECILEQDTSRADVPAGLRAAQRRLAEAVSILPKRAPRGPEIQRALVMARRLAGWQAAHEPLRDSDREWLQDLQPHDWPELVAAMVVTPAWRWTNAPLLNAVPEWLWADYTHWVFSAPRNFSRLGEANLFAAHIGKHLEELSRWVDRNLGSKVVRDAMEAYVTAAQLLPLTASADGLKRHAQSHARILAGAMNAGRGRELAATSREGRRLRVGFIASHAAAIPPFARLMDSDRFEVSLHAFSGVDNTSMGADIAVSAILSLLQADNRSQKCEQLPDNLQDQLARFQDSPLDIAVFVEDLALSTNPLAQLATARIAPLQIAMAPAAVTTGMADVFALSADSFSPELTAQFTERVATLPVTGHVFEELAPAEMDRASARATLGLSAEAFVVITAVRLVEFTGDVAATWIGLLRRVPNAVLAVQLLQAGEVSPDVLERFGREWDVCLKAAGIAPERGLILGGVVNSLSELQGVLLAGDLFLDSAAFGEPDLLHVPLALGLPIITREGKTQRGRVGAGLLRSLGLNDLVAGDDAHLQEMFELLATEPNARNAVIERVKTAMSRTPLCRDALAAADAFGGLAERAHDELVARGARKFRSAAPLNAAGSETTGELLAAGTAALAEGDATTALQKARMALAFAPADPDVRILTGRAFLKMGRWHLATDYLLAAVEAVDNASVWLDLAVALHRNERRAEAIQALEASLRLDGKCADAWVMLIQLARAAGAEEMARDALGALRECAPDDPRLPDLAASIAPAA